MSGTDGRRGQRRRGLVSVVMLIGLIVLGLVANSLFRLASGRRVLAKLAENQAEASALADSGLDRALARLQAQADYPGEIWEIPASDLGGRGSARIEIEVRPDPRHDDQRTLHVTADYRVARPGPIRQSRTLFLPVSPVAR